MPGKKVNNSDSRIRIRSLTNNGKRVDPKQFLKGSLPLFGTTGICTLDVRATVAFYLDRIAPEGSLVGYWIDRTLAFVVLLIGREKGVPTFLKAVFPQTVGHWGHELWGPIFQTPDEMRKWMKEGLSDADEQMKSKVQSIMDGFDPENGGCHETRSCFRRNR